MKTVSKTPVQSEPVDTDAERRLRKLERQNRFLWIALAAVFLISCVGIFTGGNVLANPEDPAEAIGGKQDPEKKEDSGGAFFTQKSVGKFDQLETQSLRVVDESGNLRFAIAAGIGDEQSAGIFGYRPDGKTTQYALLLQAKTAWEAFYSNKGNGRERLRIIVNDDNAASIILFDENEAVRLVSTVLEDGTALRAHLDRNGKSIDSSQSN